MHDSPTSIEGKVPEWRHYVGCGERDSCDTDGQSESNVYACERKDTIVVRLRHRVVALEEATDFSLLPKEDSDCPC